MHRNRSNVGLAIIATFALAVTLAGCPTNSVTHKIVIAQHDFRIGVQALQDAEIAVNNQPGMLISPSLHTQMQTYIQKVALAGMDLDDALSKNFPVSKLKTKLTSILDLLDVLNNQTLLGVKDANAKTTLESAILVLRGIVTQALVLAS